MPESAACLLLNLLVAATLHLAATPKLSSGRLGQAHSNPALRPGPASTSHYGAARGRTVVKGPLNLWQALPIMATEPSSAHASDPACQLSRHHGGLRRHVQARRGRQVISGRGRPLRRSLGLWRLLAVPLAEQPRRGRAVRRGGACQGRQRCSSGLRIDEDDAARHIVAACVTLPTVSSPHETLNTFTYTTHQVEQSEMLTHLPEH